MPRQPRIHMEKGLYFVTAGGDHGTDLFRDDKDREQYLQLLSRYRKEHGFKLFAYALMPKVIYLLIELAPGKTLSEVMHVINSTYTKYFNARYRRRGYLFHSRYRATVVEKEKHLAELTRLIHFIPVLDRLADTPEGYRWSSYGLYIEARDEAKEVLKRFSIIPEEQVKLYVEFVEALSRNKVAAFRKKVQNSRVMGSEEFAEKIRALAKSGKTAKKSASRRIGKAPLSRDSRKKILIAAGSLVVIIMCVFALSSFLINVRVANRVEDMFRQRESELKKDLQEKYRNDLVAYYHAMSKRLEFERKKSEERMEERDG